MKSLSKTPSPKKDRIYGSKVNPKGSASSEKNASSIKFNPKTIASLTTKLNEFKETHDTKKVSIGDLKAVYRRGLGAYSSSHRPTISGGKPNTRNAWAMARVNAFLRKAGGGEHKKSYVQDDDLLKYENGGLLAPNGNPSNLTPEQYKLVRTPAFKAWFGDWENNPENASKVVDENGEPLVVYHYSHNSFNIFKTPTHFAEIKNSYRTKRLKKEYGVFLLIKNPLELRYKKLGKNKFFKIIESIYKSATFEDGERLNDEDIDFLMSYAKEIKDEKGFYKLVSDFVGGYNWYWVFDYAKNKKYSGLIYKETNRDLTITFNGYVVFYPEQIKLADGTNTTFDMNNPDIRYADGGDVGQDIKCRRCGWEWNTKDSEEFDKYVCHNCGFDNRMYYDKNPIGMKDGGLILYKDYSGKDVKRYLEKADFEHTEFLDDINDKDIYTLKEVEINRLIERDRTLKSFVNDTKGDFEDDKYIQWHRKYPIVIGDSDWEKNIVLDGYHRIAQANANGEEKIVAFVKNEKEYKDGGEVGGIKYKILKGNDSEERIVKFEGGNFGSYKVEEHEVKFLKGWNRNGGEGWSYEKGVGFSYPTIKLAILNYLQNKRSGKYKDGGEVEDKKKTYEKWKSLVNMSYGEVKKFYDSKEGKEAGLSPSEANKQGISNGRESARWVMKMKTTPKSEWTPTMWKWANKQISFISRMSGNQGDLYDDKGNKTRKHTSLLIWGHNPKKNTSMKYENGGVADVRMEDTVQRMDDPNFADISMYMKGGKIDWTEFYMDGGMNKTCEKFDKNGERKIDMKSIEELTYCVNKLPQTKEFHFHDGKYDDDRKKLHKEIIYNIKKNLVCVESDKPIAILMGGSPASGKSTFLKKYRPYLLEEEILKVDADEIRSKLPEYKGFNATQTHLETKDIVNLLLSDRNIGIPCRFDLIYDGTMNNTKSYLPLISLLKSLGYKIFVVYIDKVPKDVIEHRALERYKKSGRFVPLEVIDDFFTKGKSALNEIKKEVDGYMIVDGSDSNYHVIERGGMQLPKNRRYSKLGEPIKITTEDVVREYKRGGELNPDDTKLKNEVVHKSGKVGGMLVGQRHSEGGIKAINKSTNQPLEMEGGEVVITRNAVSDDKKRMFEGKMMTNREILSKINESGGGVSFAKGGKVKAKDDCGCGGYEGGGNVKEMKHQYPKDFKKGVREETREHSDTFSDLKRNKISLKEASERVVAKHLSEKPNYYKNYKHGGFLTLGDKQIPSLDAFVKGGHSIKSPFEGDSEMYHPYEEAESQEHKFHRVGDKKAKPISNLLAYETYLYDNFGILFSQLPIQVQNALTLGQQALIDNYINS